MENHRRADEGGEGRAGKEIHKGEMLLSAVSLHDRGVPGRHALCRQKSLCPRRGLTWPLVSPAVVE